LATKIVAKLRLAGKGAFPSSAWEPEKAIFDTILFLWEYAKL
jgi:hypothetical protein